MECNCEKLSECPGLDHLCCSSEFMRWKHHRIDEPEGQRQGNEEAPEHFALFVRTIDPDMNSAKDRYLIAKSEDAFIVTC